jgi:signal transduction histidine kinase
VVKRHHGDLRVISEPGDTRFQVRLPLTDGRIDDGRIDDEEPK